MSNENQSRSLVVTIVVVITLRIIFLVLPAVGLVFFQNLSFLCYHSPNHHPRAAAAATAGNKRMNRPLHYLVLENAGECGKCEGAQQVERATSRHCRVATAMHTRRTTLVRSSSQIVFYSNTLGRSGNV